MFYYASKVLWFVATPSNALPLLVVLGLLVALTRWRRLGLALAGLGAAGVFVGGLSPLANALILPLEQRFPAYRDEGTPVHGIVVLGGTFEAEESLRRGQVVANESSERVLDTLTLARRHPGARIVISGGGSTMFGATAAEAPVIAAYLERAGLEPGRITVEDRSRTTDENAVFTRRLVEPKPGEVWLLVTSAWHMPRSVGAFRRAGFPVTAYPVDFRTRGPDDLTRAFAFVSDGLRRLDVATKEWAGLLAYWLSGRTSELFPAPSSGNASR
ncbi:MAG TPA: YdcF family protein [Microvirga sp.]|jgi:uncharacterized SAM-binding protein YcdF (DUF218 family)|nr:YdcF family protein [Microvirga sp.]